jgi:hypothetical protein|tara:strand:- start:1693 stop:1953 length:261 start_codon:yes stop_codon:yes gene_type:complete
MDKQKEINDGQEAERLLESDVFKNAFINYKNELIKEWESTSAKDLDKRENLYRALKVLPEVERHLRIIVEKGKLNSKDFNVLRKVS